MARPHVQAPWQTRSVLRLFVLASLPAAVVGTWNLGFQTLLAVRAGEATAVPPWIATLSADPAHGLLAGALIGVGLVLPLLLVALGTSAFWALVFARLRNKSMDTGWLLHAWLFVWLLPPGTTTGVAAVAMSFGAVVGGHIFGGTGRYLVSPALLGVLFVHFGYPELAAPALPVDSTLVADWPRVAGGGAADLSWIGAMLGTVPGGGIGTGSALACLAGAVALVWLKAAAWRVLTGAATGLVLAWALVAVGSDSAVAQLAVYWHPVLGNFAFALAFVATDPTPAPLLKGSRWLYGALFGALTVVIRTLDPTQPEGTLFALLLAGLAVPLIDHLLLRRYRLAGETS